MAVYSQEELEQFDKEMKKRLKQIIEDNNKRFIEETPRGNGRTTKVPKDIYIQNMINEWERRDKEKRTGKKHTEYTPEYGLEVL